MKKGFAWLQKHHQRPQGTYETSVLLLAVCATAARSESDAREKLTGPMRKWAQDLVEHLRKRKGNRKGWGYAVVTGSDAPPQPTSTRANDEGEGDSSSTHLAALALFAAERCGILANAEIWRDVLRFALDHMESSGFDHARSVRLPSERGEAADVTLQDPARATVYVRDASSPPPAPSGSITACGLASIQMARLTLTKRHDAAFAKDPRLQLAARQAVYDSAAWLDRHWDRSRNPGSNRFDAYWSYALAVALDLVGAERLGERAWRSELADEWIARQRRDGSWDTKTSVEPSDLVDTCWMLLFLARAT